jgi:hypothetical protein
MERMTNNTAIIQAFMPVLEMERLHSHGVMRKFQGIMQTAKWISRIRYLTPTCETRLRITTTAIMTGDLEVISFPRSIEETGRSARRIFSLVLCVVQARKHDASWQHRPVLCIQ